MKKGGIPWNKGKKLSLAHRKKLSESHKGQIPTNLEQLAILSRTPEAKKRSGDRLRGKVHIQRNFGKDNSQWKGGISKNPVYRTWQKNQWHHRNRCAEGDHTFGEWEILKKQYGFTCPSCKKSEPLIKLTLDHIIPLSKGGTNYIENIQPLCKSCNCQKHTKSTKY